MSEVAFAQTSKDTILKFNLIGHWAQNCASSATKGNWHLEYFLSSSGQLVRRMFRDDEERFSTIQELKELDDNSVNAHEIYGKGWEEFEGITKDYTLIFSENYSKYKSINSVYDNAKSFIKDGKMTHSGKDSPLIEKCN